MGLLNAIGVNNGLSDFIAAHRGALTQFGTGLAAGPTIQQGIALGTQGLASGSQADSAYAESQAVKQKAAEDISKTAAFLRSNPVTAYLAPLAEAGQGGEALKQGFALLDPNNKLDAKYKQAQIDALEAKPAAVDQASTAQGRTELADQLGLQGKERSQYILTNKLSDGTTPTLTSIYDANGREQKGYMKGDQFVPVGSPKAAIERPEYTNTQALAAGYADRMTQADKILDNPALSAAQTDLTQKTLSGVPVVGNMLTSAEFQQADQAQRDFINAILRRESGAAIAQSEFDSARKQYFPQPGDSKEVLAQKKQNRLNAIHGVARSAGPAYQQPGADQSGGGDLSGLSDDELLKQLNN